jgi:hypothetical protein
VADGAIAAIRLPPGLDGLHIKTSGSHDRVSISTLDFRPRAATLAVDPLTFDVLTIKNIGSVIVLGTVDARPTSAGRRSARACMGSTGMVAARSQRLARQDPLIAQGGRKSASADLLAELDAECKRLPLLGRSVPRTEPNKAREEGNDVVTFWSV